MQRRRFRAQQQWGRVRACGGTGAAVVGRTPGLLARLVHGPGACTCSGRRLPDLCAHLQDDDSSTLQGHSMASGSMAFLAVPWSSPAVDGDDSSVELGRTRADNVLEIEFLKH
jgi:hypothetical protein